MKYLLCNKSLNIVLLGLCFAVIFLLFVIAYIPSFAPDAYERLRQTGLIRDVPAIVAVGGISAIGWLWMISGSKRNTPGKGDF